MTTLIDNYINGNLTDAKRAAKHHSLQRLVDGLMEYGYGLSAAYDIANYLKGYGSFEAAVKAELGDQQPA